MITLISLIVTIIGALNWLLVGAFNFDLVATLFGGQTAVISRIVYVLVGIAGIWLTVNVIRKKGEVSKV